MWLHHTHIGPLFGLGLIRVELEKIHTHLDLQDPMIEELTLFFSILGLISIPNCRHYTSRRKHPEKNRPVFVFVQSKMRPTRHRRGFSSLIMISWLYLSPPLLPGDGMPSSGGCHCRSLTALPVAGSKTAAAPFGDRRQYATLLSDLFLNCCKFFLAKNQHMQQDKGKHVLNCHSFFSLKLIINL